MQGQNKTRNRFLQSSVSRAKFCPVEQQEVAPPGHLNSELPFLFLESELRYECFSCVWTPWHIVLSCLKGCHNSFFAQKSLGKFLHQQHRDFFTFSQSEQVAALSHQDPSAIRALELPLNPLFRGTYKTKTNLLVPIGQLCTSLDLKRMYRTVSCIRRTFLLQN